MTEEENRKLIERLGQSTDFLAAFLCAKKNLDDQHKDDELIEIDMRQIALFFYHAGYVACMDLTNKAAENFVNKGKLQ